MPDTMTVEAPVPPRLIQPTDRLSVTLEARQWEAVMSLLSEAPYRVSAALIDAIRGQCVN
ncbi:MAG TPA: hypothetical protein VNO55_19695 [Polyangia bacterium]|nr:hypothetical protein [Polyangia bacterium]